MKRFLELMSTYGRSLLLLLALLSFLATVSSLLFGKRLAGVKSTGQDSYAKTALGTEAFIAVAGRLGLHASRRLTATGVTKAPLLFVAPAVTAPGAPEGASTLHDVIGERVRSGLVSVLVLPKWITIPMTNNTELVDEKDVTDVLFEMVRNDDSAGVLRTMGGDATKSQKVTAKGSLGTFALDMPAVQTIRCPKDYEPLLGTKERAYIVESKDHRRLIISDPDLVHNWNLHRADHAALLVTLLRDHLQTDTVVVDEVFHGHGKLPSLGDAMGRFPNVLLSIHGVVLCLLVVLYGLRRFGPPLPQFATRRPGPLAGMRAAADVMALSRNAPKHLADRYVESVITDVSTRFALRVTGSEHRATAIDDALRASRRAPGAAALLQRKNALLGQRRVRANQAMLLARDAHQFRARAMNLHATQDENGNAS